MAKTETIITTAPNRTPLEELDAQETELLEVCLTTLRRGSGSITPSEEFIWHQLIAYGVNGRLESKMIRQDLQSFEENLSDAVQAARLVAKQYPELLQEPAA